MSVTVEQRQSIQELPLPSQVQSPLATMTVDDTSQVNSHCSQQDNCNHSNRLSVECHHTNRDQKLHTCGRSACPDDHPMNTDNSTGDQALGERSMPLQLESSNERSQPASQLRKQWACQVQDQQLPPSSAPSPTLELREEGEAGRDSGNHEASAGALNTAKPVQPLQLPETHTAPTLPEGLATRTPPISNATRSRKLLLKSHSVGSIGSIGASSESLTMSSLWEACSYDTVTDFLSSLGFDDFESPELIPDRFISHEVQCAKPSLMRQATLGSLPLSQELPDDIPLGASAETVVVHEPLEPESNPDLLPSQPDKLIPPQTLAIYNPSNSQIPWEPASLETVPEETASDLVSPRRSPHPSPRRSVDYTPTQDHPTEQDVSQGMLGANLAHRLRHHSLSPQREPRRHSLLSLGESESSTIYCSAASHLEDLDREEEERRGGSPMVAHDEGSQETDSGRRRRRAHYAPPPQLLTWLKSVESLHEYTEEQPWPFSESPHSQVQKSLSDIQPSDLSLPSSPHHSSSSIPTSPPHSSALPQLTLQSNSSNNCSRNSQTRLKLRRARFSAPGSLKQREKLYLQAEMMSLYYGLQDARLDEKGVKAKVRGLSDCLSSVYQRSERPEPT